MKSRKLVLISMLAGVSLAVYVLEGLIPPLVPVPGVKLGLANVISLVAMYILDCKSAFVILAVRIFVSSLLFGHPMSLLFSLCGGISAFVVMCIGKKFVCPDNIWALSIFGAFGHNAAQIVLAVLVTNQFAVLYYFLFLVISSVITGLFTGMCAQYTINKIKKIHH